MLEYIERVLRQQQDVPAENQDDSPQEYELHQTDLDVDSEFKHCEDNVFQILQFGSDSNRLDIDEEGEDNNSEYRTQSEEGPVFRMAYQQNLYTSKLSLPRERLDEGIVEDEPFVAEEQAIGPLLSQICGHERFKRSKKKPPKQLSDFGRSKKNLDIKKLGEFLLGRMKCMYYNGKLFYYKLPCWRPIDLHRFEVESRIVFEEYKNTQYLRSREVRALYEYICTKPKIQYTEYIYRPTTLLNFQDGTLDLITGEFHEHCAKDLLFTALDVHYHDLTFATGDVFERYVEVAGKGSEQIRQQILEMIAIALTGLQVKSFYVILGPSGTGKSQLGRLVESLVGEDKVLSLRSLDECDDRFALANL